MINAANAILWVHGTVIMLDFNGTSHLLVISLISVCMGKTGVQGRAGRWGWEWREGCCSIMSLEG